MRLRRSLPLVVGSVGWMIAAQAGLAPGAQAQADPGARIHVVIADGPWKGEHDGTSAEPCRADEGGPGSWHVEGSFGSPVDRVILFFADADYADTLILSFLDDAGTYTTYGAISMLPSVDDRGSTATIRFTGDVQESVTEPPIAAEVTIECLRVEPAGRTAVGPTPEPTPVDLGSPPPGATTFHLEVAGGAHAGTYDVWAPADACMRFDDDSWLVSYTARGTTPRVINVMAAADEDDGAISGSATVGFEGEAGVDPYVAAEPQIEVVDDGTSTTFSVIAESAAPLFWTGETAPEPIGFALAVSCGVAD